MNDRTAEAKRCDKAAVLAQRAQALALRSRGTRTSQNTVDAAIFQLDKEKYAIESKFISEVSPLHDVTELPGVPSFVYGLINVRRRIIAVIDLKCFFDLPQHEEAKSNKVIVLEGFDTIFGILTDEVLGVRKLDLSSMQTLIPSLSGDRKHFTKGVLEESLILLDGRKLLTDEKLLLDEKALKDQF